ncbi:uncharacterized protein LOC144135064 isoform X3 [Amblyomma americanum]
MCYRKQLLHPGERHAPKMASSKPVTSARKPQELPRPPPVTTAQGPASPAAPSSTPPHPEGEPNEAAASGPGPSSSAVSLPGAASSVSAPGTAVPPPPPPQQLPAELQPLQEYGHLLNRLAQFLLASMLDQPPRAHWNVLLSPISLVSTLAALVAGSEGPTQEDLCRLLNLQLPEVEAIIEQFKTESTDHVFYVANRMFVRHNCPLMATFRARVEARYMTTAQDVNFEVRPVAGIPQLPTGCCVGPTKVDAKGGGDCGRDIGPFEPY